ncbi:MAG: DUF447 domain-containing protein [Burkholderiales bacterium]
MIFETIVTTRARGRDQIVPLGITHENDFIVLAPFRPSTTLDFLLESRCAVVNYTDDVRVFAGCLTGRYDWPTRPAERVACNRLGETLAHCELELDHIEEDAVRPRLYFREVHSAQHAPFHGFNRAQAAVIEGAILVSRLGMLPREKIESEMQYLSTAIEKTAGAREREAWGWLVAAMKTYHQARETQ